MHNLVSYNQLAGSYEEEHDTRLTEYYECLIECNDQQATCKRICKEVLIKIILREDHNGEQKCSPFLCAK